MNFGSLASRLGKMAAEKSPVLLTALGVTGALATAYLAGKASYNAALVIDEYEKNVVNAPKNEDNDATGATIAEEFDLRAKIKLVWKDYIPAAGVAALTVASIVSANRIGSRRAAAVASAYAVAEKGFEEYRKKVSQKLGKQKERDIQEEIVKERIERNPRPENGSRRRAPLSDDKTCHDMFSDRGFFSTINKIEAAVNEFNQKLLHDGYASLSDFYHLLDVNDTGYSDQMGWNSDRLLEVNITTVMIEDEARLGLVFVTQPMTKFRNMH